MMMLRRVKKEGLPDKDVASWVNSQLVAIDELGYLMIDNEGARCCSG